LTGASVVQAVGEDGAKANGDTGTGRRPQLPPPPRSSAARESPKPPPEVRPAATAPTSEDEAAGDAEQEEETRLDLALRIADLLVYEPASYRLRPLPNVQIEDRPGPYDYVAPSYWLLDSELGGAHGFNTETSPGAAVPPLASLREMLPDDHLWPINSWWDYHAGGGVFKNIKVFRDALDARYGTANSAEEFAVKAQMMEYESERAMFEAFGRNKYVATGVIQWMLNNAWPSVIWHLYDYYLRPGGGYFGTKKACEPLHIQYSYDDRSVVVVNSYYQDFRALTASAKVYNLDLTEKFSQRMKIAIGADNVQKAFVIPEIDGLSTTYFVRLSLEENSGKLVSSNLYWLSTKPETLDWQKSTWFYTPTKSYANFRALNMLPKAQVQVSSTSRMDGGNGKTQVMLNNPSRNLAFFVHLKLTKASRNSDPSRTEILPVLWEDNYVSLLPGEKRQLAATYRMADAGEGSPIVEMDGWNITPEPASDEPSDAAGRSKGNQPASKAVQPAR